MTRVASALTVISLSLSASSAVAESERPASPQRSLLFEARLNRGAKILRGVVDLHTHPMAHLGFGGRIVYGAPDVGLLLPKGSHNCNKRPTRARNVAEALGNCRNVHAGWNPLSNRCGSLTGKVVISGTEQGLRAHSRHKVAGWPRFESWPRHNDVTHQTMYVEWVKRAYEGGLRVLVTLAVNSYTLAAGVRGHKPYDDKSTIDVQLDETIRMVGRHKWMEVAYSAADLRRIVAADRLAVILGVETDDIGSFLLRRDQKISSDEVVAEVRRLHRKGVRFIYPVHLTDSLLAGSAVYDNTFMVANTFHLGRPFELTCSRPADGIGYRYEHGKFRDRFVQWLGLGLNPFRKAKMPSCPAGTGHVNKRGISALGETVIREMMRLGMILDIDHLSARAVEQIFALAKGASGGYPLVSGHARKRRENGTESDRTAEQYRTLASLGGMAAVGWGRSSIEGYLTNVRYALEAMNGKGIAIGTDFNGLVIQPPPPKQAIANLYQGKVRRYRFGSKTWDYNRDGVAHYGLVPDMLRAVELSGGAGEVKALFDGAERYAAMWERAERVSKHVRPGRTAVIDAPKGTLSKGLLERAGSALGKLKSKAKDLVGRGKKLLRKGASKVKSWWERAKKKLKRW